MRKGVPHMWELSHHPRVDPPNCTQLGISGFLGTSPETSFPEFILFILTSSWCLDSGLKRAGTASGSPLYLNAQCHSQGSVQLCRMNKCPPKILHSSAW